MIKLKKILWKNFRFQGNPWNDSGIILLAVLWVLAILTLLAISISRGTHVELSLVKHSTGKLKSRYLAWAGMIYAIEQIRQDSSDEKTSRYDTLYRCGIPLKDGISLEQLFKQKSLSGGYFNISYDQKENENKEQKVFYAIQDEERFININALTSDNAYVLSVLIELLGFDEEVAHGIAFAAVDWKDEDDAIVEERYGAEEDAYGAQYHCKNRPFDSRWELLLVKGMTPEIFQAIEPYITIFPKAGALKINLDTAPELVLKALSRAYTGPTTNTEITDADSLVEKILEARAGADRQELTSDDPILAQESLPLNAKEEVLYLTIRQFATGKSDLLRVRAEGIDDRSKIKTSILAVIQREDLSLLYWQRD